MGKRRILLLTLSALSAGFLLLNTAGLTQSPALEEVSAMDADNDGISDAYELFFGLDSATNDACIDYDADGLANYGESLKLSDPFFPDTDRDGFNDLVDSNAVSRAYIRWGDPQFTAGDEYEYAHPDWLLAAYKNGGEWGLDAGTTQSCWIVRSGVGSLDVDLDRATLTNNLRYAVHYEGRAAQPVRPLDSVGQGCPTLPSLCVNLLDTNGVTIAENLFGNLLTGSNAESTVVLNIPTAKFSDAAVVQLAVCHSREGGNPVFVYEGLLYIDEDNDGLDNDQEKQIGTSDYCVDSNGNGTNDYDECFNTGSSTNNPGDGGGDEPGDDDEDQATKEIIYVDQAIGNDQFTGRLSHVASAKKGPKKTVRAGLSIVGTNDPGFAGGSAEASTLIIRSGNYNENLDIRGKDVKVFIEGKVRL